MRHVLMSSMKDEGPFVLEFVAHHRVIGFDAIHIASNDCRDGTDLLLDALAAHGAITHLRNHVQPGERPQRVAYEKMRAAYDLDKADWFMALDVDEFLFVLCGAGQVGDLTARAGDDIDVIALSALSFGTSEDEDWQPGRVTEQFTLRIAADSRHNGPVKSLGRGGGRWRGVQNHHPVGFRGKGPIHVMRGNGEVMELPRDAKLWAHLRSFPPEMIAHDLGWYNHYPIKALSSFLLRGQRGNGAEPLGSAGAARWDEGYWRRFAGGRIADRRILDRYGTATAAEMARLLALPGVADAQAGAEARYRDMIAALSGEGAPGG